MNASTAYTPGDWLAVVGPDIWALVDVRPNDSRVSALWEACGQGSDALLDVLLRDGIRSLPGFVIVGLEGTELRYAVRAPGVLDVSDSASGHSVDASGSDSWTSGRLSAVPDQLALRGGGAVPGVELPTAAGVAQASLLRLSFGATPDAVHNAQVEIDPATSVVPETLGPATAPEKAPKLSEAETADDAEVPAEESHASTYFQLLNSSTIERDALLSKLRGDDEETAEHLTPEVEAEPQAAAAEQEPKAASDATSVWTAELDEPAVGAEVEPETGAIDVNAGVIDGLPWQSGAVARTDSPEPAQVPDLTTFTPPGALPPPSPNGAPPQPAAVPSAEEPDAMSVTINRAALRRQLEERHEKGPTLLALRCGSGHLSPTYAVTCRVCGAELAEQNPVEATRPSLGQLILSNGSSVALDKGVVFGRSPQSDLDDPAQRPNLVRLIDSAEISRMHASIMLDGWQVLLRDLGSQNGTILTLPGRDPEQIRPNEDYVLEPGSVVSFADVVSCTFEVTE